VVESQGKFTSSDWDCVFEAGLHATRPESRGGLDSDVEMLDDEGGGDLRGLIRQKIERDQKWKESLR
jgi:hypothetical protein